MPSGSRSSAIYWYALSRLTLGVWFAASAALADGCLRAGSVEQKRLLPAVWLPRAGRREALPDAGLPGIADECLRGGRGHEVGGRLAAGHVDARRVAVRL